MKPLLDGKFTVLDIKECGKLGGISTVRSILGRCCFDEEKTAKGLRHLEAYKRLWDDRLGCYKDTPNHDEHSHSADSFRYLAVGLQHIEKISHGSVENDRKAIDRYYS